MRHKNNFNSFSDTLHPAEVNAAAELGSSFVLATNKQGAPLFFRDGFSVTKQEHALACKSLKVFKKCSDIVSF